MYRYISAHRCVSRGSAVTQQGLSQPHTSSRLTSSVSNLTSPIAENSNIVPNNWMRHWSMLPLLSLLLFSLNRHLRCVSRYLPILSLWHRSFFFFFVSDRCSFEESTDEHDPLHRFRGYLEMARFVYVRTEQTI